MQLYLDLHLAYNGRKINFLNIQTKQVYVFLKKSDSVFCLLLKKLLS